MAEEKAPPKKQGLHGWKATAAVFGCGTMAAFGVFGALVSLLGLFFDFTSAGVASEIEVPGRNPVDQIGEPQATIEPGDLDLCSRNLASSSKLSMTRVGGRDTYADTIEDGERRISDQCEWDLIPDYNSVMNWKLDYSYSAVISSPGVSRVDVASDDFDDRAGEIGSEFSEVVSRGEGSLADRSYFVYGEISQGVTGYILLAQTRSSVYEIRLEAPGDSRSSDLVPENALQHEASKLVSVSEVEFKLWIPGSD